MNEDESFDEMDEVKEPEPETPTWVFLILPERILHERVLAIAERRAQELSCFGGQ